jgi:hypothetical protein
VNRKILRFSASIGAAATVLAALLYIASVYPSLAHWQEVNKRVLAAIKCGDSACDTSRFTTDWQLGQPDYVLDTRTRYFLNVPEPSSSGIPERFSPLDYSDVTFVAGFRKATTYNAPDGEVWRLHSKQVRLGNRRFEIIVGYAERAPWKMVELPDSLLPVVDNTLVHEADKIAAALLTGKAILTGSRNAPSANADGFEVVDADTQQVLNWGPWLPIFLPKEVPLPSAGRRFYVENGDLYIVQTDTDGRLVATSLVLVGTLWWLGFVIAITFVSTSLVARALSRRFLHRYFALMGVRVPTLAEALRSGEGQRVEFKRGLSTEETKPSNAEDEILRSIAAFANTNDGVIFIGVDDGGHVKGLELSFAQRDRLEQKVRQSVRNRIRPMPPIQIGFEEMRGFTVARIMISRGEAPAHMLGGVIYVRDGSSDIQAQPEDLKRLITEYAT